MKRMNKVNRVAAFLAAMLLVVLSLCQAAFAADTNIIDVDGRGSIDIERPVGLTIKLVKEDGEVDTGKTATIRLYQVGEWDGSQGQYVLTKEYATSGAKLNGETAEDILAEIAVLQKFCSDNRLLPAAEGRTQEGRYTSPELVMGLYMVCSPLDAEAIAKGDNTVITPFLTTLPLWVSREDGSGEWHYTAEASPKHGAPIRRNPDNPGGNRPGGGGGTRTPGEPGGGTPTTIDDEGTPLEGLNPPSELIEDEGVPLADNPFLELIEDVLVPLGLLPKTGDGSIIYAPLLALTAASGLLMIGLIWRKIRKVR